MAKIVGTAQNDIPLKGTSFADEIEGLAGDDWLRGYAGDDKLYGGAGNDILEGGVGKDLLHGGDGFDFASYLNSSKGVYVNLGPVSSANPKTAAPPKAYQGSEADGDTLVSIEGVLGSKFADMLIGNGSASILYGKDGDDILKAGSGGVGDILVGGAGADQLIGTKDGNDVASYADSATGLTVNVANTLFSTGDAYKDSYESIETIHGSSFHDTLIASDQGMTLFGLQGADTLIGGVGADVFGFRWAEDMKEESYDHVTNFNVTNDTIRLDWVMGDLSIKTVNGSAVISRVDNSAGGIIVDNVTAEQLKGHIVANGRDLDFHV